MKPRLIFTILATLVEEIAVAAFVLWGLPMLGIKIPLGGLIAIMAGLATYGVISYRHGIQALTKKPVVGLSEMVGSKGKVVKPLALEGLIRIGSELWQAKSTDHKINTGKEVMVVGQEGLKLFVRKYSAEQEEI